MRNRKSSAKEPLKTHEEYMDLALHLASIGIDLGCGPFGAVIVSPDGEVFGACNKVTSSNDPTAHAEVTALRLASSSLETFDLTGCTIYSSCEPCPMCLGAILWARIDKIYWAASRHDAAAAGFDDAVFYEKLESGYTGDHMNMKSFNAPFEKWKENTAKISY